jgi:hypothetical protein
MAEHKMGASSQRQANQRKTSVTINGKDVEIEARYDVSSNR